MKNHKIINISKWNKQLFVGMVFLFCFSITSHAQFFSKSRSKKRNSKIPTVINSDSMDFDISKNVAVFTGNVQVNDSEMKIFCHKMIINFVSNKEAKAEKKKDKDSKEKKSSKEPKMNKSVKDIICLKDVVIIRKLNKDDEEGGEQKAIAGKAVYDVKSGKITLTINPELQRGEDTLKGEVIMFWTDSERLTIKNNSRLQMRAKSSNNE